MAIKVPTVEQAGLGQVKLDPLTPDIRNLNISAAAFGARTGQQLQKFGDGLAAVAQFAEAKHELDVSNRLLETQERSTIYAAEQKATWDAARTRANARGLVKDTQKDFQAFEKQAKKDAGYDELRGSDRHAFDEHLRRAHGSMIADAAEHEAVEAKTYNDELLGARAASSASDMVTNYFNIAKVENGAADIETAIRELNEGAAKEVVDRKVQGAHTIAYTQVIEAYLQRKDYEGAKAMLDVAVSKGRILPEKLDELDKLVEDGAQTARVYDATDKIRALHPTDYGAQRKAAAALPDDIRKDAEAEIDRQFNRDKAVRAENEYQVTDAATIAIVNGARTVEDLTPAERAVMGDKTITSLQAFEDRQALRGNGFKQIVDAEASARNATLQDMVATEAGREELRTMPLALEMGKLTEEQWNRWASYQRSLNSADTQLQQRQLNEIYKSAPHSTMFKTIKRMYPLLDKGKSEAQMQLNNSIVVAAEAYVEGVIRDTGKPPTQTEMSTEAARMILSVTGDTSPEAWIGGTFAALAAQKDTLTPEQKDVARVAIDDLPQTLRSDIEKRIIKEGMQVTDDLVEQLAGAYALQDRARMKNLLRNGR